MRITILFFILTNPWIVFCKQFPNTTENEVVIQYTTQNGLIVIPVIINGRTYKMIVDSGSPVNFVFNNKQLKTLPQDRVKVKGFNNKRFLPVKKSLHNAVDIGHFSINDVAILVDESGTNTEFGVDGIIGYPLFQHFEVEIN